MNILGICLAVLATQLVGHIWYHKKVFGTYWKKQMKVTHKNHPLAHELPTGVLSLIFTAIMVVFMNFTLDGLGIHEPLRAAGWVLSFGTAFILIPTAINYIYEQRPSKLVLVTAGFHIVAHSLAGAILGATL